MTRGARLLVLLNPGRTSRHYLAAIARAAERLGVLAGTIDLGPIWDFMRRGGPAAQRDATAQVRALLLKNRVTHVLGYTHNGALDFALEPDPLGGPTPVSPFVAAGARHILLWTDHPNWAVEASALRPQVARLLAHPMHTHWVKSPAAADELRAVAGWPNVVGLPMGEDYESLRAAPARGGEPLHDAVVILSDAAAPPAETLPFLKHDDPDPADIMRAMRPGALLAWRAFFQAHAADAAPIAALERLADAWIEAKSRRPLVSFFRLAADLESAHAEALTWLQEDSRRWYAATRALNALTAWRRNFWIEWLGRHAALGVYGCDASPLGIAQPPDARAWIEYERQPEIYARGACALTINAPHDEEGLTHKPFQIAASAVPCVHHATIGLDACFEPGAEVFPFERGPALLDAVRAFASDPARRRAAGESLRARAAADHSWDARLTRLLAAETGAGTHSRLAG